MSSKFCNVLINMEDVIGELAYEYGIYSIGFDDLIALGKKAVIVFNLEQYSKHITFDTMCIYIKKYIETPFGLNYLKELSMK